MSSDLLLHIHKSVFLMCLCSFHFCSQNVAGRSFALPWWESFWSETASVRPMAKELGGPDEDLTLGIVCSVLDGLFLKLSLELSCPPCSAECVWVAQPHNIFLGVALCFLRSPNDFFWARDPTTQGIVASVIYDYFKPKKVRSYGRHPESIGCSTCCCIRHFWMLQIGLTDSCIRWLF